jgi:hypothetical protein
MVLIEKTERMVEMVKMVKMVLIDYQHMRRISKTEVKR